MLRHPELSERLDQLFTHATNHGISALERGDTPFPFLFALGSEGGTVTVFVNDSDDPVAKGITDAKQSVVDQAEKVDAYVFGFDGLLNLSDGSRVDALILEGSERGLDFSFIFAERYRKDEDGNLVLIVVGNGFIRKGEQVLKGSA
jgi:hypothetical protein